MTTKLPTGPTHTHEGFVIDPRLGAVITRASVASREDSRSQAIFKFHHPSSLDYRPPPQTLGYASMHHHDYKNGGSIILIMY